MEGGWVERGGGVRVLGGEGEGARRGRKVTRGGFTSGGGANGK